MAPWARGVSLTWPRGEAAVRTGANAVAGEPGGGGPDPARARLQRLRDRLRRRVLDGLRLGRRTRQSRAKGADRVVGARADRGVPRPPRARQEAPDGSRDA